MKPRMLGAFVVVAGWLAAASFSTGREAARLPGSLDEISGMAFSRSNPGVVWVHNDSGDRPRVYAVSSSGKLLGTYTLGGATAIDWEDMSIGPAPGGGSYLYLADMGANNAARDSIRIYRVAEPRVGAAQTPVEETLSGVTAFEFVYEGESRDAESFFVDPLTGDFWVISKWEPAVIVYRSPAPEPGRTNTLSPVATLPFTLVTAADISPDGLEVLVRRYTREAEPAARGATYWRRASASQSLADLFKTPGETLPLVIEFQGEAIAFAPDASGFYTTTERGPDAQAPLTFYPASR